MTMRRDRTWFLRRAPDKEIDEEIAYHIDRRTVEAGVRYEPATRGGAALAEPRASAAWQPISRTTLRASWGAYAQRQSLFALQVQDGVYELTGMDRARQIVAGWDQDWSHGLTSRIELYDRTIPQLRPAYTNVTTSISAFRELAFDRLLVAPTSGRSRGVEVSLARNAGRNLDWNASYTRGSATQVVNGARVARAGDESDALHADWSAHSASNKWRFTVSAFWHSGAPYTPDSVRIDTLVSPTGVQSARATWSTGALYSRRVSTYHRADARWTRFFDTGRGRIALFVEVYNLLNTSNIRDHYTNVSISRLNVAYFDHTREQLPRIPSFGVNWEF
jgi:hypothetical protein